MKILIDYNGTLVDGELAEQEAMMMLHELTTAGAEVYIFTGNPSQVGIGYLGQVAGIIEKPAPDLDPAGVVIVDDSHHLLRAMARRGAVTFHASHIRAMWQAARLMLLQQRMRRRDAAEFAQQVLAEISERGPDRIMVDQHEAVSPWMAKRDYGITPDIIFVRSDGWSLGAPWRLAQAAASTWDDWICALVCGCRAPLVGPGTPQEMHSMAPLYESKESAERRGI